MLAPEVPPSALPSWRLALVWFGVFTATSVLFCAPFITLDRLHAVPAWGDARLIAWTLAWHARWPLTGQSPLDAPFFAPGAASLVNTEPMLGLGLAAAPLTTMAGPFVAFNALRILLPATNALAMACLVWYHTRDRMAAFVAGAALGFAYSQVATVYLGLIHLAVLAGFALAPLYLDRWWRHERPSDLVTAVAVSVLQALVSWYAAVLMVVILAVQVAWLAATAGAPSRRTLARLGMLAVSAAAALGLLWPLARPFLGLERPSVEELRTFSLDPRFFVSPPTDTWAGALMHAGTTTDSAWNYQRSYFPGFVAAVAGIAGAIGALRMVDARRMLWALPLGLVGFGLSLGPSGASGWRPFDVLAAVPGVMSFRVPGRMAVLVALGLATLVGAAVRVTPYRYRHAVSAFILVGLLAEGVMVHRPSPPPTALPTPAVFARLAADAPETTLVLPMLADTPDWPAEADYLLFAHRWWLPLANGYGRHTPPIYEALLDTVRRFPHADLGAALRFYGVSHVVVLGEYEPGRSAAFTAAADASADFQRIEASDGNVLYRVRRASATRR